MSKKAKARTAFLQQMNQQPPPPPQPGQITSLAQFMNFIGANPQGIGQLQATPQTASKGTAMPTTKTKSPDSGCEQFYYRVELNITPALPDLTAAGFSNEFLKVKQSKIEDVRWDPDAKGPGQGDLVIIDERATVVSAVAAPEDYQYGDYKVLKQGVKDLAALAKAAGADLNGYVIVWNANTTRPFRIFVASNTVSVQAASMGWPDGSQTPYPEYDPNTPMMV